MALAELRAQERSVLGKKVRFLRRQGLTPANLFGQGKPSLAVQVETATIKKLLASGERNILASLSVGEEKTPRMVLLREIQREPTTGRLLHAAFFEVSLTEQLRLMVPVVIKGRAPAVDLKGGTLIQTMATVEVECLPTNIPAHLEVDISPLTELEQALAVKEIHLPEGVRLLTDPDLTLAKVQAPTVEAVEAKEEAVAAPAEAAQGEAAASEEA